MKVRVSFTVDIDPDSWENVYGTGRKEIRADVQEHVKHIVYGALGDQGLLKG